MCDVKQELPVQSVELSDVESTPEIHIQPLEFRQIPELVQLLDQLSTVGELNGEQMLKFYNKLNNNHQVYVIVQNQHVTAAATLLIEEKLLHQNKSVGHIEDVVVDKKSRGKGLGKLMIQFLLALSQDRGCYKCILDCSTDNTEFYKKCNMEAKGVEMALYFTQ
ncbi:Glucosamine_6-phosphate N-acetyltransferase [Hexamita inflata]|uniref:Glucosamine 6-phosphate N-acetyltransferase n=1 Tax=Hexamita inflata TaxID=28002 RepID=A0ABP1GVD9_9EUKA